MSEWSDVFKSCGLREMIVKNGVTGELIYHGIKNNTLYNAKDIK